MSISLTHAKECLVGQSPKEYLGQLAVASHGLRQAKLASKGGSGGGRTTELEEFREIMEPKGVA